MMALSLSASAMSYTTARDQALFLTDKMAYELNLTDDQYNAVYEINLDYMLSVASSSDLFGMYWNRRNTDLEYVLNSYQYSAYSALEYFFRPVTWVKNTFNFVIYNHYSKGRYFRGAPAGYNTYRGANRFYNESPYKGRTFVTGGNEPKPRTYGSPNGNAQPKPANNGGGNAKPAGNNGGNAKPAGNNGGNAKPAGNNGGNSNAKPAGNNGGSKSSGNKSGNAKPSGNSDFKYNKTQSVNQGKKDFGGSNSGGKRGH